MLLKWFIFVHVTTKSDICLNIKVVLNTMFNFSTRFCYLQLRIYSFTFELKSNAIRLFFFSIAKLVAAPLSSKISVITDVLYAGVTSVCWRITGYVHCSYLLLLKVWSRGQSVFVLLVYTGVVSQPWHNESTGSKLSYFYSCKSWLKLLFLSIDLLWSSTVVVWIVFSLFFSSHVSSISFNIILIFALYFRIASSLIRVL